MNIVLISGGLNGVARQFHSFPARPVGIIELHSDDLESRLQAIIRKTGALLRFGKSYNLKEYAARHGLRYAAVFKRDTSSLQQIIAGWNTNLVITSCCPIVPMEAVNGLTHGAINLHPSLLPDYRGGNPLFWQVHDQVKITGVTVHHLLQTVDSGSILGQLEVNRPPFLSKQMLTALTEGELGTKLLREVINQIASNTVQSIEQPKRSKTRYAGNFRLNSFSKHVNLEQIDLTTLYDIVCFLGEWPAEIAQYAGWRRFFKWVAVGTKEDTTDEPRVGGTLHLEPSHIKLLHKEGYIKLVPRISIKHAVKVSLKLINGG